MLEQLRADPPIPPALCDANALYISDKGAAHCDDDTPRDLTLQLGDSNFFCWIGEELIRCTIIAAQGFPRLGARHHARTGVGFVGMLQRTKQCCRHGSSLGDWIERGRSSRVQISRYLLAYSNMGAPAVYG